MENYSLVFYFSHSVEIIFSIFPKNTEFYESFAPRANFSKFQHSLHMHKWETQLISENNN